MKKLFLPLLVVILVFMTVSCGFGFRNTDENVTQVQSETKNLPEDTTISEPQDNREFYRTDETTFNIITPYLELKYPVKWQEYVSTEVIDNADYCEVKFHALLDGISIPLYSVFIGKCDSGYLLGTLQLSSGECEVKLVDYSTECPDSLTEESYNIYLQMCEDVNVIISKLVYDNGMKL